MSKIIQAMKQKVALVINIVSVPIITRQRVTRCIYLCQCGYLQIT